MFRVEKQDGLARLGNISDITTPHLVDLRRVGKISDLVERRPPEVARGELPDAYSGLVRENIVKKLVLTGMFPREIVERILEFKRKNTSPLYLPALATPQNASLLVYMGADILDNALALRKAREGIFMTEAGEFRLESLPELPCRCRACENRDSYSSDFYFLAEHNTLALERELALVRTSLKSESLRELVEVRAKANPDTTAMLRILDFLSGDVPFPRFRRSKVLPTSEDSYSRPDVEYYFRRMLEVYSPASPTVLLLPCSARKPYMLSRSHRDLRSSLGKALRGVNEVIISSPFVAPRELELVYPILSYDTPTTGMWSEWEVSYVAERLARIIERFDNVIAYLHGGYRRVAELAGEMAGKDIVFADSREELKTLLSSAEKESFDLYMEMFRHMLSYQFGLEFEIDRVRGRYPKLEFFTGSERVARVDVRYGNLDIYGKLAEALRRAGAYVVKIEEFEVRGTIFSKGVVDADERIRPNDVVVYFNSTTLGVGQAVIPGRDMGVVDGKAVISRRKVGGGA